MGFKHRVATVILGCAAALFGCKQSAPDSLVQQAGVAKESSAAPAAETPVATITEHDFIPMRDGVRLRYSVKRPAAGTPVPAIIQYTPYASGANQADQGLSPFEAELIARGYAVVGINARGTGCSEGSFGIFDEQIGRDGYDAVEWLATRSWSDGRMGMLGFSAGGITQFYVAGQRPPHLRAIVPSSTLGDLYRDLTYVGGMLEYNFPLLWTFLQKGQYLPEAPADPDPECAAIFAAHEAANAESDRFVPTAITSHPFYDDAGFWEARMPSAHFARIEVPTFLFGAWQDEQLAARVFGALDRFRHPERLWINFTNGNHGRDVHSKIHRDLILEFLDRFVRDVDNGFEQRNANVTLAMETVLGTPDPTYAYPEGFNVPTWNIERPSFAALRPKPHALYLRSGGGLSATPDLAAGATGDRYAYPWPSASVLQPVVSQKPEHVGVSGGQIAWKAPVPPGGSLAYTGAPLAEDMVVAGPASADLWVTSTAPDTDVQVTLTEVRPDGNELYIQRGWLRASRRKLDPAQSTELRPYQTHLRADAAPLPAEPTLLRIEILPFAHAFRAGSRVRIWIDAPTGHTGFWAFQFLADPAVNTVWHDAVHRSRLVLGVLQGEAARAPMPACDTLRNQPCRPDPLIH